MTKEDIKNWKLVEVINDIEIIAGDSDIYFKTIVDKLNIPLTNHTLIDRENTQIDWSKYVGYNRFFLDEEGKEKDNEIALKNSILSQKENLIFLYGYKEPAILIPTNIFIKDWEDFIASTQWEAIIFSEDLQLIIEVSRDYYLHSNFKIK